MIFISQLVFEESVKLSWCNSCLSSFQKKYHYSGHVHYCVVLKGVTTFIVFVNFYLEKVAW